MIITEALNIEHRVFTNLFDQVEDLLPTLTTLAEVKLLATLIERSLHSHADVEQNLAFAALDHALKDKGRIDRLYEDHEEIDAALKQAQRARNLAEGRRLLKTAIGASRAHFLREEKDIFPLLEQVLQPDTLQALGHARVQ